MTTKFLEIRDRMTMIPALGIEISRRDGPLAHRAGFGDTPCILLINLSRIAVEYDPYGWDQRIGRTMQAAHLHISEAWATLKNGDVVDVEFLLQETATPKPSEVTP